MKLLLDQNLSYRIVGAIADLYPGSAHVRDFGMELAADELVWTLAKQQGFTIASKDEDFRQRSLVLGHPPKVVWLRVGNCPTETIILLLRSHVADLATFCDDAAAAFLMLGASGADRP